MKATGKRRFYEPTTAERDALCTAMYPVYEQMADRVGKDLIAAIQKEVARNQLAQRYRVRSLTRADAPPLPGQGNDPKIPRPLEEWLIATLMAAATLIIFVAVVHRYASGLSLPVVQDFLLGLNLSWAQELCIYMFIWMAKIGAAYGVRTGIHVGVDVLINALSASWRKKFIVFGLLAGALFTGVVAVFAIRFVYELYLYGANVSPISNCRCGWSTWACRSAPR